MVRRYRGASLLTNATLKQHNNFNAMRRALRTERVRLAALFPIAMIAVVSVWPRTASASSGKPDGQACLTNQSCSSGVCVNSGPPGSHTFGVCCTPTTCAAKGANCGTCTSPNTCGGGGTANVCGCTPSTTCPAGDNCGSVPDGCGRTVNCGSCTSPNTCGGGGTPNVCGCTPRTCADVGASGGTISDGCGGTLDCATPCGSDAECSATQFCSSGRCEPRFADVPPHACLRHDECLSGCCCKPVLVPLTGDTLDCSLTPPPPLDHSNPLIFPGACTNAVGCGARAADLDKLSLLECPGALCSDDSDCTYNQFCTGGACTFKQPVGTQCVFSSACGLDPNGMTFFGCCCTLPGASNNVCTKTSDCTDAGGTCECSAGDAVGFGGACPGAPCSVDSDCCPTGTSVITEGTDCVLFCTSHVCTPRRETGGCSFNSACLSGCCCAAPTPTECFPPEVPRSCTCLP